MVRRKFEQRALTNFSSLYFSTFSMLYIHIYKARNKIINTGENLEAPRLRVSKETTLEALLVIHRGLFIHLPSRRQTPVTWKEYCLETCFSPLQVLSGFISTVHATSGYNAYSTAPHNADMSNKSMSYIYEISKRRSIPSATQGWCNILVLYMKN